MTTTTTTMTHTSTILTALQQAREALIDPLDLPHVWTGQQVAEYETRRAQIHDLWVGILAVGDVIRDRSSRRLRLREALTRLTGLTVQIEQLIDDAPDYRLIADRRLSTAAWSTRNALLASVQALERGVEYFGGRPALPAPLKTLLGDMEWPGSVAEVEASIEKLSRVIGAHEAQRGQLIADAGALLEVADGSD